MRQFSNPLHDASGLTVQVCKSSTRTTDYENSNALWHFCGICELLERDETEQAPIQIHIHSCGFWFRFSWRYINTCAHICRPPADFDNYKIQNTISQIEVKTFRKEYTLTTHIKKANWLICKQALYMEYIFGKLPLHHYSYFVFSNRTQIFSSNVQPTTYKCRVKGDSIDIKSQNKFNTVRTIATAAPHYAHSND